MDDLTGMLSQILSDPQSMQQIQAVASSLGLTGGGQNSAPSLPPATAPAQEQGGSTPDLSALLGSLGGGSQQPQQTGSLDLSSLLAGLGGGDASPPAQQSDSPDLSALLANLAGNMPQQTGGSSTGGMDLSALSGLMNGIAGSGGQSNNSVSALTSLLGGGQQGGTSSGGGLPFDMGTLFKVQQAMSNLSANRGNVELLMALKPRLKGHRAKKVDDAVRIMQLIQFLPLLKETGLLGDLGKDGLGGLVGGIGNGISGIGNSLSSVLGGLLGGRR